MEAAAMAVKAVAMAVVTAAVKVVGKAEAGWRW